MNTNSGTAPATLALHAVPPAAACSHGAPPPHCEAERGTPPGSPDVVSHRPRGAPTHCDAGRGTPRSSPDVASHGPRTETADCPPRTSRTRADRRRLSPTGCRVAEVQPPGAPTHCEAERGAPPGSPDIVPHKPRGTSTHGAAARGAPHGSPDDVSHGSRVEAADCPLRTSRIKAERHLAPTDCSPDVAAHAPTNKGADTTDAPGKPSTASPTSHSALRASKRFSSAKSPRVRTACVPRNKTPRPRTHPAVSAPPWPGGARGTSPPGGAPSPGASADPTAVLARCHPTPSSHALVVMVPL